MHLLFTTGHLDLKALLPAPSICCFTPPPPPPPPPPTAMEIYEAVLLVYILPKLWHGQTSRSCNTPSHPVTASVHNTALCYNPPSQQTSLDAVFGETERLMVTSSLSFMLVRDQSIIPDLHPLWSSSCWYPVRISLAHHPGLVPYKIIRDP